jgi:DNA-binding transcriptional LysR family regulator
VDVAVIYSKPAVTDRVSDLLWPVKVGILCHPDLVEKHKGADLAGFIRENELIHMRIDGQPRHHLWAQFIRQANLGSVSVERGLVFDTELLAVQYALSGEGLALVDQRLFREHLDSGRLASPFDTLLDDSYGYYLVTDPEALSDPAVALFRSWMIERFGQGTSPVAAGGTEPASSNPSPES